MTRTGARELAVRLVFALSENPRDARDLLDELLAPDYYPTLKGEDKLYSSRPKGEEREYLERLVTGVAEHGAELDAYIEKYAVGWQFYRISRTAVSVMRVAMYEALYMPDVPTRAALNEAVELSKKYDTPETVSFINGVLGAFAKSEIPDEQ
ncbi:MAG: transcription antitermination factor NusB [Oscillospiraceae bacterium]|jgi:N utilization substance protein B|nr:transcription antitermination factor NusB [Oscillospiraceae bacterium]